MNCIIIDTSVYLTKLVNLNWDIGNTLLKSQGESDFYYKFNMTSMVRVAGIISLKEPLLIL